MPAPLTNEEIDDIVETYKELGEMAAVAEETGHSDSTVSKYVNRWKNEQAEQEKMQDASGAEDPDEFTAEPPDGVDSNDDEPDLSQMSHGEFIKHFFSMDGFGVASSFANTLARRCDVREKIPNEQEMINELMSGNSRISNSYQAESVAEVYADLADKYLAAKGGGQFGDDQRVPGGRWQGESNDGGESFGTHGGQWISADDRSSGGGQQSSQRPQQPQQPQQPGQQAGWNAPDSRQNQQSNGGGQGNGAVAQLANEIRDMKQTQMRIMQRMGNEGGNERGVQSIKDQFEQMIELNRTLDSLKDDDRGTDDQVERLHQQLQELQAQIAKEAGDQQGPVNVQDGDGMFPMLIQLAANGDLDPDTLGTLADSMGATDPEIKKAEWDFKKTEKQMENRREMIDRVFKGIEDSSGELIGALMNAFANQNRDDDGGDESGRSGGRDEVRTARQGEAGTRTGDIQVVDAEGGRSETTNLSPQARRHSENVEARTGGATEEFRGPGGEVDDTPDIDACQWVLPGGETCGEDVAPGETLCEEHKRIDTEGPTGDFQ